MHVFFMGFHAKLKTRGPQCACDRAEREGKSVRPGSTGDVELAQPLCGFTVGKAHSGPSVNAVTKKHELLSKDLQKSLILSYTETLYIFKS